MKNLARMFCILTAIFAFTRELGAATITVDGTGNRPLLLAAPGPPVPVDSRIMVGYFAGLTDSEIIADQANPGFLENAFIAFGSGGAVGEGTGEPPFAGRFIFSTSATVEPPSPTFAAPLPPNNQQIYIWTFDSNNLATDAAHQAIFTIDVANAPAQQIASWRWPTTDDGFTDRSISLDDSLSMLVGGSNNSAVFMQAIPEPRPWALFGFAVIGLLVLRRVRRCRALARAGDSPGVTRQRSAIVVGGNRDTNGGTRACPGA